jgi:hypothetical protein
MYCANCGAELSKDSNFCEKCGTKVEKLPPVDTPVSNPEVKVEEETKKENVIKNKDLEETAGIPVVSNKKEIDVSDYKPDDLDDLIPKKNYSIIIFIIIIIGIIGAAGYVYYDLTKSKKEEEKKENINYQDVINEYGTEIEKVTSSYLLDHDSIESFDEISSLVKYEKHKVVCNTVYINIDGTVYLANCSVDDKAVSEKYGKKKNILTKEGDDACHVTKEKDTLKFYIDNEIVSVYECKNDKCELYTSGDFSYNSCLDSIALIQDGKDIMLYNYEEAEAVMDPFVELAPIKQNSKVLGFIVKDKKTKKHGYITTRGITNIDIKYDHLGIISEGKMYTHSIDIENNKVVACLDNKCGIVNLKDGKEIVSLKYENMYISNDRYVVKEDGKYYLVDTNLKRLSKAYDMIFAFDDVLVVNDNNKLKIVDVSGNKLVEQELDIKEEYKVDPLTGGIFGYNAQKEGNEIIIEINEKVSNDYTTRRYVYDINSKKIEEK